MVLTIIPLPAVGTIAELPFRERPEIEVLHLDEDRDVPDLDYAGYGWARVDRLWLADEAGVRSADDALVLALHSADDGEPLADDLELEFELGPDRSVLVLASMFLATWLPRLPRDPAAIVLAMCNPHRASIRSPAISAPLYYALGDVDSWLELDDGGSRVWLTAPTWCTLLP